MTATDYATRLARTLQNAAAHRHLPTEPWRQDTGQVAFDVDLCDPDDLPAGFKARVVVTVTPS